MSTWNVARIPRVAFVLASTAIFLAGTLGTAVPASGASPASPGAVLTPIGHITPTALGPGVPATNRPVFAQPFHSLNPGALRAAKLHAAAIASRGHRGPSIAPHTPLAGLFNNLNSPGLSQLTVAPPDSTGAIGPNNYVEMVNQEIGVYDRNLNLISSTDNGTFTGAGAGLTVTDPQIQWDGQSGHWLYVALGVATGANMLIFGWSKTSDPSDLANGWCRFGTPRGNLLDDYPKLGHDDHYISVGTNVYDDSGGNYTFVTANIFAIGKPGTGDTSCSVNTVLYVADAAHPLHNADGSTAFTPVPANTADPSPFGYIVAAHSPVDGVGSSAPKIMVWHWAIVAGSPALVSDGDVAVPAFDIPAPVPQPGTSNTLDSLDARLTQAVAVNDPGAGGAKGIWTQHTVMGPGGRSVVRWYEIIGGASPTLRQHGDVGSPTDFVFNGAVSPSIDGGSAAVFYNRGGASTLPVIGAQTRTASTPLGSMDAGELIIGQSSSADLDFTCGSPTPGAPCRWGDYAGASPDPLHNGVIWGSSQVTGSCSILCGFFAQWQTQNFAVDTSIPTPPSPGNWVGTYGVDGYILGAWNSPNTDLSGLPAGVTYSLEQGTRYSWTTSTTTTDVRALQSPDGTERRATTWYDATEVRVRLNFANPYSGTLHLYAVDWNAIGRAENITVDDGTGPRTAGVTAFNNGAWVHVPITVGSGGTVLIKADNLVGNFNAVLNGLFLGGAGTPPPPPPPPPSPGNWVGTYGVDGYILGAWNSPNTDLSGLPAGVTYSLEQGTRYSWTTSTTTTDVRALQSPDGTERRATTWYDATEVRVRLNFANPYSGTLHLYAVDWNAIGRAENITVDDGTGPRTAGVTAFNNGAWVHVPITVGSGGTVLIKADNLVGNFNAVLNGLFLGGAGTTSAISLAKGASPTTYNAVGQTITYTYTITNTGNVTLGSAQFTVSDDHIGSPLGTAFNCGAPVALAPAGTVSCTKAYTISQADLNAGSVTNKATASGAGLTSNQASATATASVTSAISLAKGASPTTYNAVGQTITYTYTITNTGNVTLGSAQFTVSDDHIGSPLGTAFNCGAPVALAPAGTVSCTKAYTISQADLNAGSVTNKATASGAGLTSNQASATATASVTSAISLAKGASPTTYNAVGQTITYTYTITNTGNVTLGSAQFTVSDDHIGSPLGTAFNCGAPVALAPAGTVSCTKAYTISQADLNAGSVTNKATASGAGLTSNQASATATASVTSAISLAKGASPTTYNAVGQTITYTYTITNTGNVTLGSAQFTVSDDHIGSPLGTAFNCGAPVALAPAGTVSCTKAYTISQADLNAGSVTNKATASGAGLTSNQASATATASVTLPSAPRNVSAVRAPTRGVQLSWSAPSSFGGAPSVTYNVYRGTTAGGESTTPIATGLTSTNYLDNSSTLVSGTRYFYRIAAVNAAGTGPYSNEASAKAR